MLRIFSSRAHWFTGVGLFIGMSVSSTLYAQAQDANTASVAELQQRVQDLEAVVRQMREGRGPPPAPPATVPLPSGAPTAPAALWAAPLADAGAYQSLPTVAGPPAVSGTIPSIMNAAGWNDGFFMQSADRSFQLRITGQIQADFRGFLNDVDTSTTPNPYVAGSPVTGSPDTFLIRRARLGIEATMLDYYEFRLLPDFAGTTVSKSITDAYLNVHYWDEFQFEIGKFKQPFSYEQLIQDRYVPTMERSMLDQLVPQRDEGAMIHGQKLFGNRFDYAVAVSNGDVNDSAIDANNHKDFNGRIDIRPFNYPEGWDILRGLQIGISGGVGVENEALSTTSSPPTITTPATVTWFAFNSGVLANGIRDRISPELVYFYHSFGFAAQYYRQQQIFQLSKTSPLVDVPMDGYYVMATYLLTGEQRTDYSEQIDPLRPFDPCAPVVSPGAWELVLRIDRFEVGEQAFSAGLASNTGTTNRSSPEAAEITTGFNWYLNKWVRAQFNWEYATFAGPVKIGNVANGFTHENALYTRLQVIF
jgi:phosphate-selective porin OprO/OprP